MQNNRTIIIATAFAIIGVAIFGAHQTATANARLTPAEELVRHINETREAAGLNTLENDPALSILSQEWSSYIAAEGLEHRDTLGEDAWRWGARFTHIGENLGEGANASDIHEAFIASPSHLANVMDPDWTSIGAGFTRRDGRVYIVVNFSDGDLEDNTDDPATAPATVSSAVAGQ